MVQNSYQIFTINLQNYNKKNNTLKPIYIKYL
jgi:hypothetical protein